MVFRFLGLLLFAALIIPPDPAQSFEANVQEVDAFVLADQNRDGHLSRSEFVPFIRAMAKAGQSTAKTIRAFGAYDFAFGVVDKNGDGLASPKELRQADDGYRRDNE